MAGAQSAAIAITTTIPSLASPPSAPVRRKSRLLVSSLSSPFPSKRTRRKNHLRQKILKTLETKPYLPEFPPENPTIPEDETVQKHSTEVDQFSLSETTGFVDGVFGRFSTKSFFKIGLYLVGVFLFQTICTVWILGSNDLQDKEGELDSDDYGKARVLDIGVNGNNELKSDPNSLQQKLVRTVEGGVVLIDEPEMDKRIVEIQEMAREARQREKLEAKKKGPVDELKDDDFVDKSGIEKEVDGRLIKLRKSLERGHEKLPHRILRTEGEVGDEVDKEHSAAKEAVGPLMFKKKYKFKSPSIDSRDKPKGFDGTEDHLVADETPTNGIINGNETVQSNKINDNGTLSDGISSVNGTMGNGVSGDTGVGKLDKDEWVGLLNGNGREISGTSSQDNNKEQEPLEESKPISEPGNELVNRSRRGKPRGIIESSTGTSKEPRYDKQAVRDVNSRKSSNLGARKPRGFGKESQTDAAISTKLDGVNRNGNVRGKSSGIKKAASKLSDEQSKTQAKKFWWSSLPYVLAVLMQRGDSGEGSGLFTLRSTSQTKNGLYHTVAFEDRGDATNFSYLLESFFEDLGDFRTDIVPIPINELKEAVKSEAMNVVVVKKGQLKLYVGQPLTDVEMMLRSLIDEQNSSR